LHAAHQSRVGQRAQDVIHRLVGHRRKPGEIDGRRPILLSLVISSAIVAALLDRDLRDIFIDGEQLQYRGLGRLVQLVKRPETLCVAPCLIRPAAPLGE
jgi:hypothetical protein